MAQGGFISSNAGSAPDANAILIPKDIAEQAMDSAACIGCGACVAACPKGISIGNIARLRREFLRAIR